MPNCFNLIPGLRAFNELVDGRQPDVNGDTLGIPFEDDVDPITKTVLRLGVESKLRYETDEYVCPADKRHTIHIHMHMHMHMHMRIHMHMHMAHAGTSARPTSDTRSTTSSLASSDMASAGSRTAVTKQARWARAVGRTRVT